MNQTKNEEERINGLKKLHIGPLGKLEPLDENALKEYFSQFGKVVDLNIPKKEEPKPDSDETIVKLKGYGFVQFETLEAAKKCVRTKNQKFAGKELPVHRSIPRELLHLYNDAKYEQDPVRKVFLRNKEGFSEEELTNFFSNHPKLPVTPTKVTLPEDPNTKKPKGFAILEFEDEDDCICLVTVSHLKIEKENGQTKELYPNFFVSKNNRRYHNRYSGYGRGYNHGYAYDYYDYPYYDDYYYDGYGYGGYDYPGYQHGYGSYGGGGGRYTGRYGGGGGRPYGGNSGGRGNRRGGDFQ